jgi:hypothetical protein
MVEGCDGLLPTTEQVSRSCRTASGFLGAVLYRAMSAGVGANMGFRLMEHVTAHHGGLLNEDVARFRERLVPL